MLFFSWLHNLSSHVASIYCLMSSQFALFLICLCFSLQHQTQDERAPSAGAKSLAIPFDQARFMPIEAGKTKCPACVQDAKRWTMFPIRLGARIRIPIGGSYLIRIGVVDVSLCCAVFEGELGIES
ncbi:hypothetical protein BJ138DRAFT_422623 [Hygrophoropsis aurantiaca]|uniref:Uncharacterized protein n=1 Tax=Hygrophoropsis aurantiaca TaxID=72124 RepID=A0ACB8A377_9AGAM|nr:hypothetical protein BJ138DRAFT_422623 [Hygrophoropsis aurantiaca]